MENEHAQLDHMKEINTELLASSIIHTSGAGTAQNNFFIANVNFHSFFISNIKKYTYISFIYWSKLGCLWAYKKKS